MRSSETPDSADRLLALFDCPDEDQPNWPDFLETLRAIQGRVGQIIKAQKNRDDWLIRGVDHLIDRLEKRKLPPVKGALMLGLIGHCPVFAALAIQPAPGLQGVARALQAHYLIGMAAREPFKEKDGSAQYINNAGLGVRKFAAKDFQKDSDIARLSEARTLSQLYRVVEELLHRPEPDTQSPDDKRFRLALEYLRPFLQYIKKNRPSPEKNQLIDSKEAVPTESPPELDAENEVPIAPGGRKPRFVEKGLSESRKRDYQAEASSPKVETPQDVLYQAEVSERYSTGKIKQLTERQVHARARSQAAAIKSSLQPTPSKRSTLHFPALRILAAITFDPTAPLETQMADVLIAIMFLSGCRPEDVRGFRILRSDKIEFPADTFAIVLDAEEFRVPIRPVPQAWQPSETERHLYRPVNQHFHLKIPTFLPVGQALVDFAHHKMANKIAYEWPEDPKEIKQIVSKRLGVLSEAGHMYLYPERVSHYLARAVYSLEGDMADANLLTGSRADKDDSRAYYYSPPVRHLQKCYHTVWHLISRRLVGKPEPRPMPFPGTKGNEGPFVGSAGVPVGDYVRKMNRELLKALQAKSVGKRDTPWARNYHNAVTAALYLQVLWMTGIRPVRDVIEYRQYDPVSGFLAVDDKDNEEESKVRLVWLPPALQHQMQRYHAHLQDLARRLHMEDPEDLAFRFLASSSKRILKYSKNTFLKNLGVEYGFRENAHRHYIRTRLRELGVDGAYVDALLGHGGIGREAYGRFSVLTPGAMRDAIESPLATIWRELGFGNVI